MHPREYNIIIGGHFENERFNRARKAREIADKLLRENKISLEEWEDLYTQRLYMLKCVLPKKISRKAYFF